MPFLRKGKGDEGLEPPNKRASSSPNQKATLVERGEKKKKAFCGNVSLHLTGTMCRSIFLEGE